MNKMDGNAAELWLKSSLFYYGIISPHPKLSISYLKKVITYAKSKGREGGYPKLNWTIWKHMSVNKMLLSEELSWAYFDMFITLQNHSAQERLRQADLQLQAHENDNPNIYRNSLQVPTLAFVLFLYIQQANKISLRRSTPGEDWPGMSPRSSLDLSMQKNGMATSTFNEQKHIQFFQQNIAGIIELLMECFKGQVGPQNSVVFPEVVKALGFVIKGQLKSENLVLSLFDTASNPIVQSGYNKVNNKFDAKDLTLWIKSSLVSDPYGLENCLNYGAKLKWTSSNTTSDGLLKKTKIITNNFIAQSNNKMIVFYQCSNQTVARQSEILVNSFVKINKCHLTHFYLLSPMKSVSIEKCSGLTVVLGPVASCVRVLNCQDVTIIAPCRSISVHRSSGIILHISTLTRPIISNDNNGTFENPAVTLAPYNTFYCELEQHLAQTGHSMSHHTDQWNNPFCVENLGRNSLGSSRLSDVAHLRSPRSDGSGDASMLTEEERCNLFRLMPVQDFYVFAIPFHKADNTGKENGYTNTTEIPGGLPKQYAQAVRNKQRATEKFHKIVSEARLTRDERKSFQAKVEEQFKTWLKESGNQKQLDVLDIGKTITNK